MNPTKRYIEEYKRGFFFEFSERILTGAFDVKIELLALESRSSNCYRECAKVTFKNAEREYRCELCDYHDYNTDFFPVILKGKRLILFRKTLYGFTLLDADSLVEVYEYFPEGVFDGKESFIITDARQFGELLVFEGCYWGCQYEHFVFDLDKGLFLPLSHFCKNTDTEKTVIEKDVLILYDGDQKEICISIDELMSAIISHGQPDF